MAGGGANMGGVSSTGAGAPSGTSPFGSNPVNDSIMSDDFGRNPGGGASGPGTPMLSNIMPGLMSGAMGLGGFGQQQQLAPGATLPTPNSQEAYRNFIAQASFAPGMLPTYEQWSQRQNAGYGQPQVPSWMQDQLKGMPTATTTQGAGPTTPINQQTLNTINSAVSGTPTTTPAATTPTATTPAQANTGDQIGDLYQNLLGRKADEGGYNFWNQALQGGTSIDAIKNQMMASPEYQTNQIKGMYQNLLGREADQGGLDFWANAAKQGTSLDAIKNQIMQSNEYMQGHPATTTPATTTPAATPTPAAPPPMFNTPIMSQSGGAGSGGALNFQYRRGGIASLIGRR